MMSVSMSILLDTDVAVSQLYVCSTMLSTCRGFTPVLSGVITRRSSDGDVLLIDCYIEQKLFCYHNGHAIMDRNNLIFYFSQ